MSPGKPLFVLIVRSRFISSDDGHLFKNLSWNSVTIKEQKGSNDQCILDSKISRLSSM